MRHFGAVGRLGVDGFQVDSSPGAPIHTGGFVGAKAETAGRRVSKGKRARLRAGTVFVAAGSRPRQPHGG